MTDEYVESLAARYRAGERTARLRRELKDALLGAENGEIDPGFGRELEAAIGSDSGRAWERHGDYDG